MVAPGDLHGLKLRVPPSDMFIRLVRALGANPTPLSYGEVYSSLQTRLVDGAENNWRTFHSSRQFEVARHWAQSEHSYSPEALLMSRRRFDALSGDDQELTLTVATQSVPYMRELCDRAEAESRAVVIAAGVRVTDVPRCFSPRPPPTTCTAPSCRSTAVGSHARPHGQPSNARRRARLSAGQYLLRS